MQASEKSISHILTEKIVYEIPAYQRPYSWEEDNVNQLLNDIWDAYVENSKEEYFVGSLITVEIEKNQHYQVVDGQQRLTTFNLIFSVLANKIQKNTDAKADYKRRILPRLGTARLLLRDKDRNFFSKHVLNFEKLDEEAIAKLKSSQRNLIKNLGAINSWFEAKAEEEAIKFADYLLEKVFCVLVITESQHSAFRLFNVLNARGMSLSNADLIKNELFKNLKNPEKESDLLEKKWLELEEEIGIEELDSFFGHYRTTIKAEKASNSIHEEFEPIINSYTESPDKFLDTLITAAKIYTQIKTANYNQPLSMRATRSLNRVGFDEWIPPLMRFMLNKKTQHLIEFENEFIENLERITYQNWIRRLGRTARLTVYYQLIKAVQDNKSADEIRKVFKDNSNNEEFKQFLLGDVYGKPFAQSALIRLDEAKEDISVTREYKGKLSIEHVLPQALRDEYWKDRFKEEEHQHWLNKIGNLVMLSGSKNSKAQYYDFPKKKKIYSDRQSTVSFELTKQILNIDNWDMECIKQRQIFLVELAEGLWGIN